MMDGGYLDLDDILATSTKVTCTVDDSTCKALSNFVGATKSTQSATKRDTVNKIELPIWLVEMLMSRNSRFAQVQMPRFYNASYRQVLGADAVAVDLHRIGPYFYRFGLKLASICTSVDAESLTQCLFQTFLSRIGWLLTRAIHSHQAPTQLDNFECKLYECGVTSERRFASWRSSNVDKSMVQRR